MKDVSVFWFRRDFRYFDNKALYFALNSNYNVLPIFIFDPKILINLDKKDHRVSLIYNCLENLNQIFSKHGSGIKVFFDDPLKVFTSLSKKYNFRYLFFNRDYEPYAIERDSKITNYLNQNGIVTKTYKDHVIFEQNDLLKKDGTPYKVYTPYSKFWLANLKTEFLQNFPSENYLHNLVKLADNKLISLSAIGFIKSNINFYNYDISSKLINNYEETRNFPFQATSKIGVFLRFGLVSIRSIVKKAVQSRNNVFLKELIWREFFMQILYHFPETVTKSFKSKYDNIKWRQNDYEFQMWCEGKTGYPLVDAGMRELSTTGFMHNRVRMLVASFLCKHLLIDWRLGEAYFAKKLFDFELSSNIGNWQWVVGSGVDAAPYFRIFNPDTQQKKFDKNLFYIKKWVPEYLTDSYQEKIVDHSFARKRCLNEFKRIQ